MHFQYPVFTLLEWCKTHRTFVCSWGWTSVTTLLHHSAGLITSIKHLAWTLSQKLNLFYVSSIILQLFLACKVRKRVGLGIHVETTTRVLESGRHIRAAVAMQESCYFLRSGLHRNNLRWPGGSSRSELSDMASLKKMLFNLKSPAVLKK